MSGSAEGAAAERRCEATIAGRRVEVLSIAGAAERPTLVLLHEGLGSLSLWRDFPAALARRTACPVLAWSRYGHGRSEVLGETRTVRYMHEEALNALPALLDRFAIDRPVLVGHSDGASIALIHAGDGRWRPRGLVLIAPHVFVEEATLAGIRAARAAYAAGELRGLARHHADAAATFRGWNDIWLAPEFRAWTIEASLPGIQCPLLLIQGAADEYGTLAQLDAIAGAVRAPVERLILPASGHAPQRDAAEATLAAIARFVDRLPPCE